MTKINSLLCAVLTVMAAAFMTACGGVDHSDPRSVAEKALTAIHAGDYETIKTLINPDDEYKLKEADKMIELSKKFKEEHPDYTVEEVPFTYVETVEEFTGAEITDASKSAKVKFESEKYPRIVILEKVDGKWYFERFK